MPASSTTRTPASGPGLVAPSTCCPLRRFDSKAVTLAMIDKRPAGNKGGAHPVPGHSPTADRATGRRAPLPRAPPRPRPAPGLPTPAPPGAPGRPTST
ncbi:hypothetical protein GCM10010495_62050 [Kitasatospora herbaricolor]|nr:hypothetical protein GCM10010495_62050 [Kitasatospora herbaricolor]